MKGEDLVFQYENKGEPALIVFRKEANGNVVELAQDFAAFRRYPLNQSLRTKLKIAIGISLVLVIAGLVARQLTKMKR